VRVAQGSCDVEPVVTTATQSEQQGWLSHTVRYRVSLHWLSTSIPMTAKLCCALPSLPCPARRPAPELVAELHSCVTQADVVDTPLLEQLLQQQGLQGGVKLLTYGGGGGGTGAVSSRCTQQDKGCAQQSARAPMHSCSSES
jgi:hypothetical protein